MAVLSTLSAWDHYLCSTCSAMSAVRPGAQALTAINPVLRWPGLAFGSEGSTTPTDALAAGVGLAAAAHASTAEPLAHEPTTTAASVPGSDTATMAAPIDAEAPDREALPTSTRMREIVVQAERTDNPWGI